MDWKIVLILCYLFYIILYQCAIQIKSKIFKKNIKSNTKKSIVQPTKFLPHDELYYLNQIFLLLAGLICIISTVFAFYLVGDTNVTEFVFINSIMATIFFIYIADKSYLNFIICLFLIPINSIIWMICTVDLPMIFIIINCLGGLFAGLYFISKFIKYTKRNDLGLTVVIFGLIISSSILITIFGEKVNLIDNFVMISNAFTSNGYYVAGTSYYGKLDNILLVWGGYLLSGVGTATLAAAIINNNFKNKLKSSEVKINKLNEELEKLNKNNELKDNQLKEINNELKELKELLKK